MVFISILSKLALYLGKDETMTEKLWSILAQLEFHYQINAWQLKGVPFKDHLYVKEVHPITGVGFCEREDDGHVFKVLLLLQYSSASHVIFLQRIGQSLRQGGPLDIHLERFEEALHDTSSGLTYSALSGVRKQSVQDVERLFGNSLIDWMEKKGYLVEAKYLRVVRNWRRASDERGLSDEQRSHFNNELLDYILDELMPWHRDEGFRDFSLMEVNQYVNIYFHSVNHDFPQECQQYQGVQQGNTGSTNC